LHGESGFSAGMGVCWADYPSPDYLGVRENLILSQLRKMRRLRRRKKKAKKKRNLTLDKKKGKTGGGK